MTEEKLTIKKAKIPLHGFFSKRFLSLLLWIGFHLFVSLLIVGVCYKNTYRLVSLPGNAKGFSSDNWIQSLGSFELPFLQKNLNYLHLSLDTWRPGKIPAELQAFNKDILLGDVLVTEEITNPQFRIRGNCKPCVIRLITKNPYQAPNDSRLLGVKWKEIKISSRLGLPIVSIEVLLTILAISYILTLVLYLLCKNAFPSIFFGLFPILLCPSLATVYFGEYISTVAHGIVPVSILFILMSFGWAINHQLNAADKVESEPINSRACFFLLLLAVALGTALRFYGIDFGLPEHRFHPDEVVKSKIVARMFETGDFNPNYFLHPSLILYLTYAMRSIFNAIYLMPSWDLQSQCVIAGRTVSALAGSFSILFIYDIGKTLYSKSVGTIAAFLFAFLPLSVTLSRYMKEDSLLTCFFLLSLVFLFRGVFKQSSFRNFALSAVAIGFATSTKYPGALGFLPVALGYIIVNKNQLNMSLFVKLAFLGLIVGIVFIVCSPYVLVSSDLFVHHVGKERGHVLTGHSGVSISPWDYYFMYQLVRSIFPGMTALTAAFCLIGLGLLFARRNYKDLIILALLLFYYIPGEMVSAKNERYILPVLPYLCIAAAVLLTQISLQMRAIIFFPIALLVIFSPLYRSTLYASELNNDTRKRMISWIAKNISSDSKLLIPPYAGNYAVPEISQSVTKIANSELDKTIALGQLRHVKHDYVILPGMLYNRYFSQDSTFAKMYIQYTRVFRELPIVHIERATFGPYSFHNPSVLLISLKPSDIAAYQAGNSKLKESGSDLTLNEEIFPYRKKTNPLTLMFWPRTGETFW